MDKQMLNYYNDLETQLSEAQKQNRALHNATSSMFGMENSENIVKWQLDLKEDLERIYHLLKGDIIFEDDKGNIKYIAQKDPDLIPLNEFGTQLIMNIMSFYLNRNTILSNYDEETIRWKVYDFGVELSDLIFNRYEEMMATTTFENEFKNLFGYEVEYLTDGTICVKINGHLFEASDYMIERASYKLKEHLDKKEKMYPMIVKELVDCVHSAYLRALKGLERSGLRTAITVNQSDSMNRNPQFPMVSQPKKRSILNPFSWFRA